MVSLARYLLLRDLVTMSRSAAFKLNEYAITGEQAAQPCMGLYL